MKTRIHVVAALATALAVTGCVGAPVRLVAPPDRAYDTSRGRRISAEDWGFQLLFVIPLGVNDRHENAWRDLESQARDEYIGDIRIEDSWTWGFVGTAYTVKMEAMAYPYVSS